MPLTIGKLAKQIDVTIEAARYYQRIGLLAEPEKTDYGYRDHPSDAVTKIRFIKRAQQAGFTLKEITTLLALNGSHCADVRKLAEQKCQQIEEQIKVLMALRQVLEILGDSCQQSASSLLAYDFFQILRLPRKGLTCHLVYVSKEAPVAHNCFKQPPAN
ncbi:MAG: MerR family DNA-binding protein [Methylobacter sp.]|nr:MerR family DNA-binding protein [Methylobacter sp.]